MKIGRVIVKDASIMENCSNTWFFKFGNHLYIYSSNSKQCLFLDNRRHYDDAFNINYNQKVYLPAKEIEDIEVFSVVKNNSFT